MRLTPYRMWAEWLMKGAFAWSGLVSGRLPVLVASGFPFWTWRQLPHEFWVNTTRFRPQSNRSQSNPLYVQSFGAPERFLMGKLGSWGTCVILCAYGMTVLQSQGMDFWQFYQTFLFHIFWQRRNAEPNILSQAHARLISLKTKRLFPSCNCKRTFVFPYFV